MDCNLKSVVYTTDSTLPGGKRSGSVALERLLAPGLHSNTTSVFLWLSVLYTLYLGWNWLAVMSARSCGRSRPDDLLLVKLGRFFLGLYSRPSVREEGRDTGSFIYTFFIIIIIIIKRCIFVKSLFLLFGVEDVY